MNDEKQSHVYLCVSVHVFLDDDLLQRLCHIRRGHTWKEDNTDES